jgi:Fe-S oxidoreductase
VSALEEYDDLVDQPGSVPEVATTVAEFVNQRVMTGDISLDGAAVETRVAVHGHCHSTARGRDHHPVALLRQAGYEVEVVETSCCGMAGAFGYETEHYDLSMALGDDLEAKLDAADPDVIATTGASCRQQLHDREIETKHPLQLLAEVVA